MTHLNRFKELESLDDKKGSQYFITLLWESPNNRPDSLGST